MKKNMYFDVRFWLKLKKRHTRRHDQKWHRKKKKKRNYNE
jgi:hypothetical protein